MKMSGSVPASRAVNAYILFSFDQADTILSMLKKSLTLSYAAVLSDE